MTRLLKHVTLIACTLAALACGTAESPTTPDAGTAPDAGPACPGAGTAPVDQCQNDTDLGWLKAKANDTQTGRELARAEASNCGLSCLNEACPDQCAIKCMVDVKGVKLSGGCAGCYGRIVICTIENCIAKCINDPQSDACKQCQEEKGCNADFYGCTGNLD
jgi:hypothetical protein